MCRGWWGRGQSLGSVLLCLDLLQGNTSRAEEHLRGISAQQLPAGPFVPRAPPGQGKGWVGLARSGGDAWGSLQTGGFQLCSLSFCCSPPAFAERRRTLSLVPGNADHADPEISKGAANIGMDPVGAVLLALQSQAEVKLSSGKRLFLIKAGTTSPRPRCPSHENHPERAEQTALFRASTAACRTAHLSAHPGPSIVVEFHPSVRLSPKRSHVRSPPGEVFSLGRQRAKGSRQTPKEPGLPRELPDAPAFRQPVAAQHALAQGVPATKSQLPCWTTKPGGFSLVFRRGHLWRALGSHILAREPREKFPCGEGRAVAPGAPCPTSPGLLRPDSQPFGQLGCSALLPPQQQQLFSAPATSLSPV